MTSSTPIIWYEIQNYHMERRTMRVSRSVPDGKGGSRTEYETQEYWVRVNTHYAKEKFKFREWTD